MTPEQALGATGPLAAHLPGFSVRAAQQAMATQIADAIAAGEPLICEAGTGTGKTFAYLVPVLLSGRRTLISTATRTLQDQLYQQDLPLVRRALGSDASAVLLKGRANYVCLQRLAAADATPELWPRDLDLIGRVAAWARRTVTGDVVELEGIPEDAGIWPLVTSTVDNCLGQNCPEFEQCFVVKARRAAAAADIVVVNHHLLFADMALREEGFGELLPTAQVVIVDEAHQLPELAAHAFGQSLSGRQVRELARDALRAAAQEAPDTPDLLEAMRLLDAAVQRAQTALARRPGRYEASDMVSDPALAQALADLEFGLERARDQLSLAAERGPALEHGARRAVELGARLEAFAAGNDDLVRWVECSARAFALHVTPLSVATQFQARLAQHPAAWIFCSATLAIAEDFSHFREELGLDEAVAASWASPFDYARQALLYLPRLTATPNSTAYLDAVIEVACEVIGASRGRAFLLCTSHRALEYYAGPLRNRLRYPVLVQGEAPRAALLEEFRRLGNAVLIGTATFWEGVDVRGEALSCVIIDKLPFAPPDDPLLRARVRRLESEGRNAFVSYQVPVAALTLKQGAGRLIRDLNDRGVLVLCDPRVTSRPYGTAFLRALPPMPQTRDLDAVAAFFATSPHAGTGGSERQAGTSADTSLNQTGSAASGLRS